MNIVLIGYRCCGKTTVGKLLARDLERKFLDTDRLIEKRQAFLYIPMYLKTGGGISEQWRERLWKQSPQEMPQLLPQGEAS